MVNDDKPFLRIMSDGVLAYGSPWSGKHGLSTNICVPLQGICSLQRGQTNVIRPAKATDLQNLLCHQAHAPVEKDLLEKTEQMVKRLTDMVPLWELSCNKEPEAAQVAYEAMCCPYHKEP